jgi:hypothetical protein
MMIRATVEEEVINDMTDYVHGIRPNIGQFAQIPRLGKMRDH